MSGWMVSGMVGHTLVPHRSRRGLAVGRTLRLSGLGATRTVGGRCALAFRPRQFQALDRCNRSGPGWLTTWPRGRVLVVALCNLGATSLITLLPLLWHDHSGFWPKQEYSSWWRMAPGWSPTFSVASCRID